MGKNLSIILKTISQLPLRETTNFLIYQFMLRSRLLKIFTPTKSKNQNLPEIHLTPHWISFLCENQQDAGSLLHQEKITGRAEIIANGKILLFSSIETDLDLDPHVALRHWSSAHTRSEKETLGDIKFIWEPARFDWAVHLAQAYFLTRQEKYADYFWKKYFEFVEHNPLNQGPNWESAQEVALRLISWTITLNFLQRSSASSPENNIHLCTNIADHADRILPTLSYAKAQNNNHLLSEAVGLFTAGTFLQNHPHALKWRSVGKKWFEYAIQRQIDSNGEYIQHSSNYHRLMLSLSIWMEKLVTHNQDQLDDHTLARLRTSVLWLWNLLDQPSGCVPNLGHNDGSLILPFSTTSYADYRPIIQASSILFTGKKIMVAGPYDDLANWLAISETDSEIASAQIKHDCPRIGDDLSWGTLRAMRYRSRPAHADQLHVDLWYQGVNLLLDAGTFQYNAPAPYDNGFAGTLPHNTITFMEQDQMTRASRFLWLDWAQAHISQHDDHHMTAAHDGYLELGAVHQRELMRISPSHWRVIDRLHKFKTASDHCSINLHWLVPDWKFQYQDNQVVLDAPFGTATITIHLPAQQKKSVDLAIFRAGRSHAPINQENPLLGWYSPSYGVKQPALSILYALMDKLPVEITTEINFS